MASQHTSIHGNKVDSDGVGIQIETGSASIVGNTITSKGSGIVVGASPSQETKKTEDEIAATAEHWYKKPIGIIFLSVASMALFAVLAAFTRHYFPSLLNF